MADETQRRLLAKLKEIFQLERGDLDFGVYRILNIKSAEITAFLERDLLPQARKLLDEHDTAMAKSLQAQMEQVAKAAKTAGVSLDDSPEAQKIKARMKEQGGNKEERERRVFSDLCNFFGRYYREGDFISLRRYKKDVYALPYEGEEVKLHWANADQYYIKSSESFGRYAFTLPGGKRVVFSVERAATETDNNKASANRCYALADKNAVSEKGGELTVRFWRIGGNGEKQNAVNEKTAQKIINLAPQQWRELLAAPMPTEKDDKRTLLNKHLTAFTAKNNFDYFVHKDLGAFLRRELDFFIKNEVLRLDDLDAPDWGVADAWLGHVRVLRQLAAKIIDFLAQLENFQKKVWLKKKFVLRTNWCATVGKLPEVAAAQLIEEAANNKEQAEEWENLLGVKLPVKERAKFIRTQSALIIDTRHFPPAFADKLLAAYDDIDAATDGVLIHGDNFQALNLLSERFRGAVKCVYIDPPYNTSEESFIYKNNYKHSSWVTMMENRLVATLGYMTAGGTIAISIDDEELFRLKMVGDSVFGEDNFIANLVFESNPRGRTIDAFFATCHDYVVVYGNNAEQSQISQIKLSEEQRAAFNLEDSISKYRLLPFRRSGGLSTPAERPNSHYPIFYDADTGRIDIDDFDGATEILPIDSSGTPRVWRQTPPSFMKAVQAGDIVIKDNGSVLMKDRIKNGRKPKTVFKDPSYDASSHGTVLLANIMGDKKFSYPKSLHAVTDTVRFFDDQAMTVLDYFAGTGTTAHAVINLNREDGGARKFILAEMGEYFKTVLLPRIKKVIYAPEWKDGKPKDGKAASAGAVSRAPGLIKYQCIESYEDALDNLVVPEKNPLAKLFDKRGDGAKEDYMLRYFLDVETRDSASLLDIRQLKNPFAYNLNITRDGETKPVGVDLPETFNYLLGLRVRTREIIDGVLAIEGEVRNAAGNAEDALVLWRNEAEISAPKLNEWFEKRRIKPRDSQFAVIYVNGDNHLENLRRDDETWKVRLIEDEFRRLMFDGAE